MYGFIFYFIYSVIKSRSTDPFFFAAGTLWIVQVMHTMFLITLLSLLFDFDTNVLRLSENSGQNKFYMFPLALVWFVLVQRYFRKHFRELNICYKEQKVVNLKNGVIVLALTVVPFVVTLLISEH